MAWPVNARYVNGVANATRIGWAFLNAIQDAIIGVYGGTKTVKALEADGVGDQAATASPGDLKASGSVYGGSSVGAPLVSVGANGVAYGIGATPSGYTLHAALQTTNNSITGIVNFTLPTGKACCAVARVVGLKSDSSVGGAYVVKGMFKNNAGVVSPIGGGGGSTLISEDEDDAAWGGVSFLNSGTTISVTVGGKAATTINWKCIVDVTIA